MRDGQPAPHMTSHGHMPRRVLPRSLNAQTLFEALLVRSCSELDCCRALERLYIVLLGVHAASTTPAAAHAQIRAMRRVTSMTMSPVGDVALCQLVAAARIFSLVHVAVHTSP